MKTPATSILIHGKPQARGTVCIPMELAPESWEIPGQAPAPANSIPYVAYRDETRARRAFYNCNPCARDGSDQAQLQHLRRQRLYFMNRGKLEWRFITRVEPQVFPDANREYIDRAQWVIHYSRRR